MNSESCRAYSSEHIALRYYLSILLINILDTVHRPKSYVLKLTRKQGSAITLSRQPQTAIGLGTVYNEVIVA